MQPHEVLAGLADRGRTHLMRLLRVHGLQLKTRLETQGLGGLTLHETGLRDRYGFALGQVLLPVKVLVGTRPTTRVGQTKPVVLAPSWGKGIKFNGNN